MKPFSTGKRPRIIAMCIVIALLFIFFHKVIFTNRTYFVADTLTQFHPWKVFVVEQIRSGKVPLWNPYSYSGMPFLANMQAAVFYPPNIIFYIFPFVTAYKMYILFHIFLAWIFMYFLMKDLGVSENAAFVSGVVFAFNGYLLSRIQFLSVLGAAVWLPVEILILRRALKGRNFKNTLMLGIIFTMQFLAGHPQVLIYSIFTLSGYTLYDLIKFKRLRGIFIIAFAGLIAICMSAVQLIPSLELILNSVREGGLDFSMVSYNSFHPRALLNFFNPFLKYHPNFWAFACYAGIIPVVLSISGSFSEKRIRYFFGLVFLVSIFFAMGKFNPLFKFFYRFFPPVRLIRFPATILYLSVFSVAVLSGFGFDRFRFSRNLRILITVLILCDLFIVGQRFNPVVDNGIFTVYSDKIAFLRARKGFFRFFLTHGTEQTRRASGRLSFQYWSNWKDNLYGNINVCFQLFNTAGEDPLRIKRYSEFLRKVFLDVSPDRANKLLSLLNVRYVLSRDKIESGKYKLVKGGAVKIYENTNFMPRAFFVSQATFKKKEEILDYMMSNSFDPKKEVVIEKIHKSEKGKTVLMSWNPADIIEYESDKVFLAVSAPCPGWVILSDTYFPGWKATVDGKKVEIFRANYLFRAVAVNKGSHVIKFVYEPVSYKIGAVLTVISLLFILVAVFKPF